jgi:hypothetical protein
LSGGDSGVAFAIATAICELTKRRRNTGRALSRVKAATKAVSRGFSGVIGTGALAGGAVVAVADEVAVDVAPGVCAHAAPGMKRSAAV